MSAARRIRGQHFIGMGDGERAKKLRGNDDVVFLQRPNNLLLKKHVRRREPSSFLTKLEQQEFTVAPAQGPWQVPAMVLLCVLGLLLALFIYFIDNASQRETLHRRSPAARKKKKVEPAVFVHNYYTDHTNQSLKKRPTREHLSPGGIVNRRMAAARHETVLPPPGSRNNKPSSPKRIEGIPAAGIPKSRTGMGAKPLSGVSSFASISQNEPHSSTREDDEQHFEEFLTPKAGRRGRVSLPPPQEQDFVETAVPFAFQEELPFMPPLTPGLPPQTESTLAPRSLDLESGALLPQREASASFDNGPSKHPVYRVDPSASFDHGPSKQVFHASASSFDDSPSRHPVYPGHLSTSKHLVTKDYSPKPLALPPHILETPNRAKVLASVMDTPAKRNIIHKRPDLRQDTNTERSLTSSIDFEELILQEVIGGGGFGQVWKAKWRDTPVAVKVLTGSAQDNSLAKAILEEFAAEINMLRGMRHPNICLYMGACLEPPNRAIVTELAENGSLWDALRLPLSPPFEAMDGFTMTWGDSSVWPPVVPPAGTWPWSLVKTVAVGAARGMRYLHSGTPPVLHRDLKSANLLLDRAYTTKVCDFGLSRLKAQQSSMTGNCGTVQWMAPEVLANQAYAEPADVYSFGIILWEMLSRECPYDGLSAIQCALSVLNKNARPEIPSWCPPDLEALITSCWEKDPSKRPTFAQVLMALESLPE